ncbi:MAG: YqgE/AlgH family protein [Bergeyella sp.]|nr:YqgE/AlgH family protein [Bergeyella sp.]
MLCSYKGKILISTPDISGDIFSRTVVLVIDHNENGAFGLILNKKNREASASIGKILGSEIEIYKGGPVSGDHVFIIGKGVPVTENYINIDSEYYLTEEIEAVIASLLEDKTGITDFKFFSGYSGWTSRQLEAEVEQKFWIVVELYNLDYTLPNNHNLWKSIMQNLGGEYLLWVNTPEDISMN